MRPVLYVVLSFVSLSACTSTNTNETSTESIENENAAQQMLEGKTWDEVIGLHDEVMPEMTTISRIKRRVSAYLEEQTSTQPSSKTELLDLLTQLQQAEDGMWDWMYNFQQLGPLQDSLEHQGILDYLEYERKRIVKVKADMEQSIVAGRALMEKYNIQE
ncbi:MAG: hypothetical protein AAFU60_01050 [Bacteroidota bacterium]